MPILRRGGETYIRSGIEVVVLPFTGTTRLTEVTRIEALLPNARVHLEPGTPPTVHVVHMRNPPADWFEPIPRRGARRGQ